MWESNKENAYSSIMWESNKENVCHYFGYDRHHLRTLLESKNPNEEDALWEFLFRSAQYLARDPSSEGRMFPLKKPSFPLTPIEVFQKTCPLQRRKLFFKSLYQGDILYLKVIEEKTDCFKLLVLDKYKGCMKIDDLGIVMDLPKLPQELKHLFPHSFSVIKAALCSGNMKERFMCVTLDKSIVKPENQDVSLGPVYEPYNMHYHGNPFLGISFTDNLFMTGEIRVRQRLPELSIVGIKEKNEYSHQKKPNRRVFSKSLSRTSLRKRLLQETSSGYYELAVTSVDQGRVKQALSHLKQALYIWNEYPEALILAGKCYNIIDDTPNAFMCCMKSFETYPSATAARKHMCMMLVDAARVHLNYNDKSSARESLEMARIIDPDNENAVRLLKEAKLANKSSMINPDEKYEFPCPFHNEVDVCAEEPEPRSKRKHHKRKTSKKKHQKHHKSSKLSLSPKKSTHDAPFKSRMNSKFKSQFSEPLPTQSEPHENEETMKFLIGLIEKAQAEFRLNRSLQEVMLMNASGSPHLPFSQEIPLGHSLPFTPSVQSNSNISEFAVSHPVQTSSASTPHENLKTLYDLVETAKREIQIQNQMKASQLTQPSSDRMASEDTTILHTIISTINKLIFLTQDMVKNSSHSSIISESLPLLQSQLLSNQLVAQYPLSQLSEVNQVPPQIVSPHPTQTFLSSPLCPDKLQTNQAPMFPLPAPESSSNVPKNSNSLKQSIVEGKTSVEPNSESSSIPFLEYPVSTPGHSKHTILEDQSTSVPVYQDSGPLSMLKTKYFKPLSPSLNQPDMASDTKHAAENANKSEAPLPDSTNQETKSKKKKSPEASRRTPQRYRLTPPKKHERNASRRHRSRSPKRVRRHSHKKRDRSSRRRRSRSIRRSQSPRRRRSRSYSPRRYRSRSSGRSRSRSFKRSRSNSLRRSKRSRSRSPAKYRRKVHLGASKRSPSPRKSSLPHSLRKGIRSTISLDSSSANFCEVVVSSPSFSDSSIVSVLNFESRSPSPCAEITKDIPPETPFLRSTPDDFDPEISLVGFHRSKSPPWQRHVSITTNPARHKASSSSSSLAPHHPASKSYSGTSKESDDRSLSPPKRTIPVICSRIMSYK